MNLLIEEQNLRLKSTIGQLFLTIISACLDNSVLITIDRGPSKRPEDPAVTVLWL